MIYFLYWISILWHWQTCFLLVLVVYLCTLWDFLHRQPVNRIEMVLFFLSNLDALYFSCVCCLIACQLPPVCCWLRVLRVDSSDLFQSEGEPFILLLLSVISAEFFGTCPLSSPRMNPLIFFWKFIFYHKWMFNFLKLLFLHLLRWSCRFFFFFFSLLIEWIISLLIRVSFAFSG